jgi:adenosylcobinamide-GDP ribazoletransferase
MLMLTDLRAAFSLLTRLPIKLDTTPDLARAVWAFPIVGLIVNGIGALVYWAAHQAGMPPLLAAAWTLAATILLTGALHEDGLSDTADGFGGGTTKARKLEIMRDSRIGTYGALALIITSLTRTTAIAALPHPLALITVGILGRAAMILPLLLLPPAREDGLSAAVRRPPTPTAAAGLTLAAIATLLQLPTRPALVAILAAAVTTLLLTVLARSQIGGHTGDVLGATEVLTECAVLTVIAASVTG